MEGFYRKKGVEGALVEEKAFFLDLGFFLVGEESGNRKGFIIQIASFSFGGWCGDDPHDRLLVLEQKILDWLRFYFWERLKLQLNQVLSLCLASWALAQVTLWSCGLLFDKPNPKHSKFH